MIHHARENHRINTRYTEITSNWLAIGDSVQNQCPSEEEESSDYYKVLSDRQAASTPTDPYWQPPSPPKNYQDLMSSD